MVRLVFGEVRLTPVEPTAVLVLREAEGKRELPIWITASAAASVMAALEDEVPEHPTTHDLLIEVLGAHSLVIEHVVLTSVDEGRFSAQITVNGIAVASRVSDAVALALRSGAPINAPDSLLADAGVLPEGSAPDDPEVLADAVEQFREFLANVNADDFDSPPEEA